MRTTKLVVALLVLSFATAPAALAAIPPAPVLISPSGTIFNPDPTYTWNASTGATEYTLQVFNGGGVLVIQRVWTAAAACNGSTCARSTGSVLALGYYTWKVKAKNSQGGTQGFRILPQ